MTIKKYFNITEVSAITGLPLHKLRYIEKSDPNVKIIKIRCRRYYNQNNINYIKTKYSNNTTHDYKNESNMDIIVKIDKCLNNFQNLLHQFELKKSA